MVEWSDLREITGKAQKKQKPTKPIIADWIESHCMIRPKAGGLVPFKLNKHQRELCAYVQECWERNIPARIVIDKSRQLGISTLIQAICMFFMVHQTYWNILTVAHVEPSAKEIFDMQRRFWMNLPDSDRPTLEGGKKRSREHLTFTEPWNNRSTVLTAGGQDIRGTTYQIIHASEVAFYSDAESQMLAMSQSIHEDVFSLFFVESTANGLGTFKYYWDLAANPESGWVRFFFSWIYDEECVLGCPIDFELTPEEIKYQRLVQETANILLTNEQLNWARRKREDKCHGKWEDFHREYPATAELSFMSTSNYVFNQQLVAAFIKQVTPQFEEAA